MSRREEQLRRFCQWLRQMSRDCMRLGWFRGDARIEWALKYIVGSLENNPKAIAWLYITFVSDKRLSEPTWDSAEFERKRLRLRAAAVTGQPPDALIYLYSRFARVLAQTTTMQRVR